MQELINLAKELFEGVENGSITGDAFGEVFIDKVAEILAPIEHSVKIYQGVICSAKILAVSEVPIHITDANNSFNAEHKFENSNIEVFIWNSENTELGEEAFYYLPTTNNVQITLYSKIPPKQFYKLLIVSI